MGISSKSPERDPGFLRSAEAILSLAAQKAFRHHEFDTIPRRKLFYQPSPVQRLRNLEAKLGVGVEIYLKRDDLLLPMCGNKVRYIEYVLGAYEAVGADSLIHCGGPSSNYLAQLAIVGAREGIPIRIIILGEHPEEKQGNLLLEDIFGADIRFRTGPQGISCSRFKEEWAAELIKKGGRPMIIGHPFANYAGILGYMRAYAEIGEQIDAGDLPDVDQFFLCSSGNSYLGLRLAAYFAGDGRRITAFSPIRFSDAGLTDIATDRKSFVLKKAAEFCNFIGSEASALDVDLDESAVGEGYGTPSEDSIAAVRLLASTEGVLMDPIYSGKAMAGVLARLSAGDIPVGSKILFIHTGGGVNVFSQNRYFSGNLT